MLNKESKAGNNQADYFLGIAYQKGIGVQKDLLLSRSHYNKSIDNGLNEAKQNLSEVNEEIKHISSGRSPSINASSGYSQQSNQLSNFFSSLGRFAVELLVFTAKVGLVALSANGNAQINANYQPHANSHNTSAMPKNDYQYESSFDNQYKYDLSNPTDQIRYSVDPSAKLMDDLYKPITPSVGLEEFLGQHGGGLKK
jgi:TPR repeat protein